MPRERRGRAGPLQCEGDKILIEVEDLAQMPVRDPGMGLGHLGGAFEDDRQKQLFLVHMVVVNGARGHAGFSRDHVDAGTAVPLLPEHRPRRLRDGTTFVGLTTVRSLGY
ncbi:hypothetical protein GCM10010365_71040 [Streptomyces poonensis]|uniref:Uncharacterized protein n=1 Tax=Streptomyces poonensis TaxID=68255 RepID=A0A918QCP5_9ACTN|nr:hypothetical protein GCM10010365_71040 [Streptomyces poonensis]GLJ92880.1 hypothetical protein GCM10017589_54910 [Streptomyces poonensis]